VTALAFPEFFMILFVACTVHERISVLCWSRLFLWVFNIIYIKDLSLQIVQLISVDGATVLFAAYSVYGRIFVRFAPEFFVFLLHCLHPDFFAKKVQINMLGGATITYAVYTAF